MMFGVDRASVDGNAPPSWPTAKAQGPIAFAIVRACYGTSVDPQFTRDWYALGAAGLVRGAYLFLRFPGAGSVPSPEVQAKVLIKTVGRLAKTDLPVTIDIEFPGGRVATGLTAAEALAYASRVCDAVHHAYGAAPMIYTSSRVWREDLRNLPAPHLAESPLWLARYWWAANTPAMRDPSKFDGGNLDPNVPPPWGDFTNWWIHQYQGDAIGMPGIPNTVDMNRFNSLVIGATGDRVRWVQRRLGGVVNGHFGPALEKRVRVHQERMGMVPDGIIGPRTFATLCWLPPIH
jgi:GH25 family lysozyme M1 (1,4-beta-N-acetylmuramidase)